MFRSSIGDGSGFWLSGGLLADEWEGQLLGEVDQRSLSSGAGEGQYRGTSSVRTSANLAISKLKKYSPSPAANVAEMYFVRGFAEMQLAETICNGVIFSDGLVDPPVEGRPETDSAAFVRAIASYDSALVLSAAGDAFSLFIRTAATIGRARAMVGLNQQPQAAALIAGANIATAYTYDLTFSTGTGDNPLWTNSASFRRYSVADSMAGNARDILVTGQMPFFSAKDPRVPVSYTVSAGGKDTVRSTDGSTFSRTTTLWARSTPIPVVNGIDARMIEAEARAKAGDVPAAMAILNSLRAAPPRLGEIQPTAAQLPPLTSPGNTTDLVTLVFREKAFWTFSRGQRLGDLRRLMRQYGRSEASTFPTGDYYRGGTYGHAVNFPVPLAEQTNPNYVGCLDRKP